MSQTGNTTLPTVSLWIEPLADGRCELVLSAIGATERRIPYETRDQANVAIPDEVIRYMEAVEIERRSPLDLT